MCIEWEIFKKKLSYLTKLTSDAIMNTSIPQELETKRLLLRILAIEVDSPKPQIVVFLEWLAMKTLRKISSSRE